MLDWLNKIRVYALYSYYTIVLLTWLSTALAELDETLVDKDDDFDSVCFCQAYQHSNTTTAYSVQLAEQC